MKNIILGIVLFTMTPFLLLAEEKPVPSPTNLPRSWWSYFEVKGEELKNHTDAFTSRLETELKEIPSDVEEEFSVLNERLLTSIKNYSQVLEEKAPVQVISRPISKSYRLVNLIELHQNLRQLKQRVKTDREELNDRNAKISMGRNRFVRLEDEYYSAENRSVEKFKKAMQLITFRFALANEVVQSEQLKKEIEVHEKEIHNSAEELTVAKERITVDSADVVVAENDQNKALKIWNEAKKIVATNEKEVAQAFSFRHQTERERLRHTLLNEELIEAKIISALAENSYIQATVKVDLLRILLNDPEVDLDAISNRVNQDNKRIEILSTNRGIWQKDLERTIEKVDTTSSDPEIQKIQEQVFEQTQKSLLQLKKLGQEIDDTRFVLNILSSDLAIFKGGFAKWFSRFIEWIKWGYHTLSESTGNILFFIGTTPITLMRIIRFCIVIAATFWVSHLSRIAIKKVATRKRGIRKALRYRLERLFHYLILFIGFLIALTAIGFDFSNFLLIAGALGVGLGFGLQSIFNNFISGIIILFESQLQVGDYIEMETGLRGEVVEINFRSTYIKTNDGVAVIVPNSEFINYRVINWTLKENYRRVRIPFSVAYDSDKDLVVKLVQEAAAKVPITLKKDKIPEPKVGLVNLGHDGIEFELVVWVDERATKRSFSTRSVYLWAIHDILKKHDIEIPFPQRTIHIEEDNFNSSP